MIYVVLLLLMAEIGWLGYLLLKRLDGLASLISSLKFDPSCLADIKFTTKTKDDIIREMSVSQAVMEYTRCRKMVEEYIKVVGEMLVDVVAAGVSKALTGKNPIRRSK